MTKGFMGNKWMILSIILAITSIVLLVMVLPSSNASPQKAAEMTINYINTNILEEGIEAKLESIEDEKIETLHRIKISIDGQSFDSFITSDGKYLFPDEPIDMSEEITPEPLPEMLEKDSVKLDGGFTEITDLDLCLENDKPIVYFFGSDGCSHCAWQKPVISEVVAQFGNNISYRENFDGQTDIDILMKYGQGAIPTIIVGCKYYRVGSGELDGAEADKETLKNIICMATGGNPSSVCN
jgi:thiol-disulfide isomerase/thioredoxin